MQRINPYTRKGDDRPTPCVPQQDRIFFQHVRVSVTDGVLLSVGRRPEAVETEWEGWVFSAVLRPDCSKRCAPYGADYTVQTPNGWKLKCSKHAQIRTSKLIKARRMIDAKRELERAQASSAAIVAKEELLLTARAKVEEF